MLHARTVTCAPLLTDSPPSFPTTLACFVFGPLLDGLSWWKLPQTSVQSEYDGNLALLIVLTSGFGFSSGPVIVTWLAERTSAPAHRLSKHEIGPASRDNTIFLS